MSTTAKSLKHCSMTKGLKRATQHNHLSNLVYKMERYA